MVKGITEERLLADGESTLFTDLRHLCVSGSNETIGRRLAEHAKATYGVDRPAKYDEPEYGRMRRRYFARNWPAMAARMRGVERAYRSFLDAQPADERDAYDVAALIYDVPPANRPRKFGCSAIYIPPACSTTGKPIVARNYDAWRIPATAAFRDTQMEAKLYERSFVIELQPRGRRKLIALGGHDLLSPFQDALNDRGLYVTSLADDAVPLEQTMTMAGGCNTGLGSRHLLMMLAENCDSVAEAKEAARAVVVRKDIGLHWLIADAHGAATVLGIDGGQLCFTEAPPDRPLVVTNHPLHPAGRAKALKIIEGGRRSHCEHFRATCDYPQCMTAGPDRACSRHGWNFAYDTFVRSAALETAVSVHVGKYSRADAEKLIDMAVCAFKDDNIAGVRTYLRTRTAWSLTSELAASDPDLSVRFYVDDGEPAAPGANHLSIRSAAYRFKFGFRRELLWKDAPRANSEAAPPHGPTAASR